MFIFKNKFNGSYPRSRFKLKMARNGKSERVIDLTSTNQNVIFPVSKAHCVSTA